MRRVTMGRRNEVVAFLLAAASAAFLLAFVSVAKDAFWGRSQFFEPTKFAIDVVGWSIVAFPFALLASTVLGVPMFILFSRTIGVNVATTLFSGYVVGALACLAVNDFRLFHGDVETALFVYGPIGVASSAMFWFMWRGGKQSA